jgi:hypothetical protein
MNDIPGRFCCPKVEVPQFSVRRERERESRGRGRGRQGGREGEGRDGGKGGGGERWRQATREGGRERSNYAHEREATVHVHRSELTHKILS